ncbi:MAG: hypothetical protein LBO20_08180 [Bifidobacteriaceae bacterium]|nr:hypothetical protein [Bifidobacteriaceae bacterium]
MLLAEVLAGPVRAGAVLAKPTRADLVSAETMALTSLLSRLDLRPLDREAGRLAFGRRWLTVCGRPTPCIWRRL